MSTVHVDERNFENEVIKAECTVLIDLYADWCAPCKMLAPILEEIADEHPEYKVCKINVDESPSIAAAFRASSIPMLVVVKDSKVSNYSVGYMEKADILKML
jgi:thioredoxin 1